MTQQPDPAAAPPALKLPEPKMSIDDAIAHHSGALSEAEEELPTEFGDTPPTLSTRFELVEIEVPALD